MKQRSSFRCTPRQILALVDQPARLVAGTDACLLDHICSIDNLDTSGMAFCEDKRNLPKELVPSSLLLINEAVAEVYAGCAIVVEKPRLVFARLVKKLVSKPHKAGIRHATALIDDSAQVSETASIGAHSIIEAGATIEDHVVIETGVFVGKNAFIGADTLLRHGSKVLDDTIVGKNCVINCAAIIGADGFGWNQTDAGYEYITHVGRAVLEDEVFIGASAVICRGTYSDTIIANGAKIDGNVWIGHNVKIGAHTLICAEVGIAGSTQVGQYCVLAGGVGVVGHLKIVDDVHIGAGTLVDASVDKPGYYLSRAPLLPMAKALRLLGFFKKKVDKIIRLV